MALGRECLVRVRVTVPFLRGGKEGKGSGGGEKKRLGGGGKLREKRKNTTENLLFFFPLSLSHR